MNCYKVYIATTDNQIIKHHVETSWCIDQFKYDIQEQITSNEKIIIIGNLMVWACDIKRIEFLIIKEGE